MSSVFLGLKINLLFLFLLFSACVSFSQELVNSGNENGLVLQEIIHNSPSRPRYIKYSDKKIFIVSNVNEPQDLLVYNQSHQLHTRVELKSSLSFFGFDFYEGTQIPAPGTISFSNQDDFIWVTYSPLGGQKLQTKKENLCDQSFVNYPSYLYKLESESFMVQSIVPIGDIPTSVVATPSNDYIFITNKCSQDISVISTISNEEVIRIPTDGQPEDIVIEPNSQYAYFTTGSDQIGIIRLSDFSISYLSELTAKPRNLLIDEEGEHLYISFPQEGKLAKMNLHTGEIIQKVYTGKSPGQMVFSPDQKYLYIVNEFSHNFSKIRLEDMENVANGATHFYPRTIEYDPVNHQVWVGCDAGTIMVWTDNSMQAPKEAQIADNQSTPPALPYVDIFNEHYIPENENSTKQDNTTNHTETAVETYSIFKPMSEAEKKEQKFQSFKGDVPITSHEESLASSNITPNKTNSVSALNSNYSRNIDPAGTAQNNTTYNNPSSNSQNASAQFFSDHSVTNQIPNKTDHNVLDIKNDHVNASHSVPTNDYSTTNQEISRKHYLVLGSFSSESNAEQRVMELSNISLPLQIIPHGNANFRIISHAFNNMEQAKVEVQRLKRNYQVQSWILTE